MYQPYKMNNTAKYQELSSFPEVTIFSSGDSSIIIQSWIFCKQSRLKIRIEKQSKTLAPDKLFQLTINLSLNRAHIHMCVCNIFIKYQYICVYMLYVCMTQ